MRKMFHKISSVKLSAMKISLISGAVFSVVETFLFIIIGFIRVPILLNYLGNDLMGLWRLGISLTASLNLLQAGLLPYIKTRMSEASAKKDVCEYSDFAGLIVYLCLFLFVLSGFFVPVAYLIDWGAFFHLKEAEAIKTCFPFMVCLFFSVCARMSFILLQSTFDARLKVLFPRILMIISSLTGFACLFVGIWLKKSISVLILIQNVPFVFSALVLGVGLFNYTGGAILFSPKKMGRLLKLAFIPSVWSILIQQARWSLVALPPFFLTRYIDLKTVTTYSIALQLADYPLRALGAIMKMVWPSLTVLRVRKQFDKVVKFLFSGALVSFIGFFILSVMLTFWGSPFVEWWTKGEISPSPLLLFLISVFCAAQALGAWPSTYLWSAHKIKQLFVCTSVTAVLVLLLSVVVQYTFGFSVESMAGIVLCSYVFGMLIPMSLYTFFLLSPHIAPLLTRILGRCRLKLMKASGAAIRYAGPPGSISFSADIKVINGGEIVFGKGLRMHSNGLLQSEGKLAIGENFFMNRNSLIVCLNSVKIGDNVTVAERVSIRDHDHRIDNLDLDIIKQGYTSLPIEIGDDVWIGCNVVILKGVKIGSHSVVGAGSVVTKDIPDFSVAVGVPAKVVRTRRRN
jgi:acetyltransferase-like isoleucine patch superfamily enzyme/O-antigen/teichoic acid export membrane protein